MIRPAVAVPIEIYTPERKAELLLSNAVDAKDYAWAIRQVKALDLDSKAIPHRHPKKACLRAGTGRALSNRVAGGRS